MLNPLIGRVIFAATLTCALVAAVPRVEAQAASYRAPRAADGHPDLNGIWQAINTANWNVEAHPAAPGAQHELGAQWCRAGRISAWSKVVTFRIGP